MAGCRGLHMKPEDSKLVETCLVGSQRASVIQLRCANPPGYFHRFDSFRLPGDRRNRRIYVFLPIDHDRTEKRYRVLFMNDGDAAFFNGGLGHKSWKVAETLHGLYGANEIDPLLVVAVCPVERDEEYTHTGWRGREAAGGVSRLAKPQIGGGLEHYTSHVADRVKPFIDAHYRTRPAPADTMILGASHGGLAAFYMACRRPDAFGLAAAVSPSFWVGLDDAQRFPNVSLTKENSLKNSRLLKKVRATLKDCGHRPRIYVDWGLVRDGQPHNDGLEACVTYRGREMVELLESEFGYRRGRDLFVKEDPQGEHSESSWARRLPGILKLFASERGGGELSLVFQEMGD